MAFKKVNKKQKYEQLSKVFGEKLFELRTQKRLTIKDAAKKIKIAPVRLSKIEKGEAHFTIPILYNLAFLYNFEPKDFINLKNYSKKI
jgi:transcriptional regulator with XRE-family HTH domain